MDPIARGSCGMEARMLTVDDYAKIRLAHCDQAIAANSGSEAELLALLELWKNWIHLAI